MDKKFICNTKSITDFQLLVVNVNKINSDLSGETYWNYISARPTTIEKWDVPNFHHNEVLL